MSEKRTVFTEEQKKEYWKKKIFANMVSFSRMFNPKLNELLSDAKHIGVSEASLENIQTKITDAFTELQQLVMDKD